MNASTSETQGFFGRFGGMFVSETLQPVMREIADAYNTLKNDADFRKQLADYAKEYIGRETPLYFAERLSREIGGAKIYLKREDLCHTGAHKINNVMGQILVAKFMGKKRIIAETGAGQHGVATATDKEALDACVRLSRTEGIIPALESSHALAYAMKLASTLDADKIIVVNLSGRGDKDVHIIRENIAL